MTPPTTAKPSKTNGCAASGYRADCPKRVFEFPILREDCDFYEIRDCKRKIVYVGITQQNPGTRRCNSKHPRILNLQPDCPTCALSCKIVKTFKTKAQCLVHERSRIISLSPFMNDYINPDSDADRAGKRRRWQSDRCPAVACNGGNNNGFS
jgi:hypothetical protein